ncbi:hypothetical protein [Lysinibacillus fusiformis]|uniref:hypothetical protein n=1 Tax=Lysinibacillus fusiformis TaxID=28031 RepID=UPI003D01FB8C
MSANIDPVVDRASGVERFAMPIPGCAHCGHSYEHHTGLWAGGLVVAYGVGCACGRCSIFREPEPKGADA